MILQLWNVSRSHVISNWKAAALCCVSFELDWTQWDIRNAFWVLGLFYIRKMNHITKQRRRRWERPWLKLLKPHRKLEVFISYTYHTRLQSNRVFEDQNRNLRQKGRKHLKNIMFFPAGLTPQEYSRQHFGSTGTGANQPGVHQVPGCSCPSKGSSTRCTSRVWHVDTRPLQVLASSRDKV